MTIPAQTTPIDPAHAEANASGKDEFPFDLDTPEGEQQWQQWLQTQAQARIQIVREQLKAHGLADENGWTLPKEMPDDMKPESATSTATG